jgi:alkaline phosphatase
MNKILPFLIFFVLSLNTKAQYTSSSIFAHNDYVQPVPFSNAYNHQVGYIEADVFLQQNDLFVAHTLPEIDNENTLEALYLQPLQKKIIENKGFAYPDPTIPLTLMIDLKSDGVSTLNMLVRKLKKYPELISCPTLQITISGNVPDPAKWKGFPEYIYFDGRPNTAYSEDQLKRISLISTSFTEHVTWNGKGVLEQEDRRKIASLVNEAHNLGKKIRFWAIPDFRNAWIQLMEMNVDVINTDDVSGLSDFIKNL